MKNVGVYFGVKDLIGIHSKQQKLLALSDPLFVRNKRNGILDT